MRLVNGNYYWHATGLYKYNENHSKYVAPLLSMSITRVKDGKIFPIWLMHELKQANVKPKPKGLFNKIKGWLS